MTEDAWLAVGQNMTHMHEIKPLMPHVYTEANRWISTNQDLLQRSRPGYWMDMRTGNNYELLYPEKVIQLGRNIVYFSSMD